MAQFNLNDYATVNERLMKFYEEHKDGTIKTEIIENNDQKIVIKAYAYKDASKLDEFSTGHAEEIKGEGYINKTSAVENCETSAVGRALALMGYEIKKSIASKEEVANAKEAQSRIQELDKKTVIVGKCDECGIDINAAVYNFSKKQYGRPLCFNCQKGDK